MLDNNLFSGILDSKNYTAKEFFSRMDDYDLNVWEQLYGDRMGGFYRNSPRRACYAEMRRRGMKHDPNFWRQKVDVEALKRDWKLGYNY